MTKIDQNLKERVALLSVYDKSGIVEFAKQLARLNFKLYASGGTFKTLQDGGVESWDVAGLIGGGAILGHRVVTLSREIYAGLLARNVDEDIQELKKLGIPRIDLVCVDLYPLEETINKFLSAENNPPSPPLTLRGVDEVIEKTDIGGPTLLRAAAKGRRIVIADAADRHKVVDWLKNGEPEKEEFLSGLAAKAEYVVANYALISAKYHSNKKYDGIIREQISESKYGENAWQVPAGLYGWGKITSPNPSLKKEGRSEYDALALENFRLVAGAAPSYNNWADVDRMLQTVTHMAAGFDVNREVLDSRLRGNDISEHGNDISESANYIRDNGNDKKSVPYLAVGVKHGNACGAAIADNPSTAIKKMLEGDLRAIFGGLVMVNFEVDEKLAEILLTHKMASDSTSPASGTLSSKGEGKKRRLLDGIVAPAFTQSAIEVLKRKGDKCRFLANPALQHLSKNSLDTSPRFRYVRGGFLKQPNYNFVLDLYNPNDPNSAIPMPRNSPAAGLEISSELSESQKQDIVLAWAVGSTSNSNTITLVKDGQLLGNGVGQQDRVGGCELAIKRARDSHHDLKNSVAYSDSFFPFPDGPQKLIDAGIKTIFATRGSVKDEAIKKVCADNGVTLVTLPDSLARGFFGH